MNYAVNHWCARTRFLDDAHLPLDKMPPTADAAIVVGRGNLLFAGSMRGGP